MKYRLPFPRPRRDDGTLPPALAAAVLAAMLLLQLVVPRAVTLPEPGVVRPFALEPARLTALAPDAAILARPLFAARVAAGPAVVEGPVGGARAIGVVVRGGARNGFVQAPDGTVVSLAPGASYRGWRLVGVRATVLLFRRGGETATLPVTAGASPTQPLPAPPVAGR
ncbi:hypothetical protein [Sphingomonas sp.]|uniref:hypothetical protein n=1 Tax=Sphingomonas sp. TaxID=28214 RepID=UPI003B009379